MRPNLYQLLADQPRRANGRRWSIRSLAIHLGESRQTLADFADGRLKAYPHRVLEKLATFFAIDPGELWVTEEEATEPDTVRES